MRGRRLRCLPLTWGATGWQSLEGGGVRAMLPPPPSGNRSARHGGAGAHYTPETVASYRRGVATALCHVPRLVGDVRLAITWVRVIASGDGDNRVKTLQDALRGTLYADDAAVSIVAIGRVDSRTVRPGVVLEAWPVDVPACCPNCGVPLPRAVVLPPEDLLRPTE